MFFKKKSLVAHIRLSGVIGNVGRFQQGLSYASHHEIIEKAFSLKKLKLLLLLLIRQVDPRCNLIFYIL